MSDEATLDAFRRGDNAEARRLAQLDLEQATLSGDIVGRVDALCMLARTALRDGRLDEVESRATEAHLIAGDDPHLQRMPVHLRAVAARMAGRNHEARSLYGQSIALNEALDEVRMVAAEHRNLAYVEIHAGNHAEARRLFAQSHSRLAGVDAPTLTPYLTFDEATIAVLDGDFATARKRLHEAEVQFAQLGVVPDPDDASEIARVRQRLGDGESL